MTYLFDDYAQYEENDLDDELLDDNDDYDTFESNPYHFVIKIHNLADGATSLTMVADMLRDYSNFLDSMVEDGFIMSGAVSNGSGFAYKETD